jgi:branched-chain amino acid transport system ATP-binding protein
MVGLRPSADVRSLSLPYGERRALEIAVALAAQPRVLFLDEPTQGRGAEGRNRLLAIVQRLKRQFTIVMIEHDMDFLFSLADQVSVIHWGQVIAQGTPAELAADPWVRRANLGTARHA